MQKYQYKIFNTISPYTNPQSGYQNLHSRFHSQPFILHKIYKYTLGWLHLHLHAYMAILFAKFVLKFEENYKEKNVLLDLGNKNTIK